MLLTLISVGLPLLVIITYSFLTYRLGFFSAQKISGRLAFLFGGFFVFAAALWEGLKGNAAYPIWFVPNAYPLLDLVQFLSFVLGTLLSVVGLALYANFWNSKKEELLEREQQLSLLSELQKDAREPYQLVELFNICLKKIVSRLPESSGALFLINRHQRQLLPTAVVGLTKQETAQLEHYPLGQNLITQSLELGEPMVAGSFEFVEPTGLRAVSRFSASLVLPLVSGDERVGGILILSEKSGSLTRKEIKFLAPVAEWLAEKMKSARLMRELNVVRKEREQSQAAQLDFGGRIVNASKAVTSSDAAGQLCRSLVGLAGCQSAHLIGLRNGELQFFGGSDPLIDLSENFQSALIDALDRDKPLMINQEASTQDERSFIARSTLVFPAKSDKGNSALIFVREGGPFRVGETELKQVAVFAELGRLTLRQSETQSLDLTRRRGLDKVLSLLRLDLSIGFDKDALHFVNLLENLLPPKSLALMFIRQSNGSFKLLEMAGETHAMEVLPGEGFIGQTQFAADTRFYFGRARVQEAVQGFDEKNRNSFIDILGERGQPSMLAACPISRVDTLLGVACFCLFNVTEEEKGEWQRLFTLAAGLYSLRLTINQMVETQRRPTGTFPLADDVVERLSNHLLTISGGAEAMSRRQEVSGEVRHQFEEIRVEAKTARELIRNVTRINSSIGSAEPARPRISNDPLNEAIESVLEHCRISNNLFMLGGRPREINLLFGETAAVSLDKASVESLVEDVLNRFASRAEDEDVISLVTYKLNSSVYLDVSRHHRNFPPADRVAQFGEYQPAVEVVKYRPADIFLNYLGDKPVLYAFDRLSPHPSYLSFMFPIVSEKAVSDAPKQLKVLAIDDQEVILDLISAMCQSSGYSVKTAQNGETGLKLAMQERFDIVLTDLAMPGMSGLEVAREIKKRDPQVPIILITGWEVNLDRQQLDTAGITQLLYKPFRIEQLTEIIGSLARSRTPS